ncbi:MAG: hypothetical protein HY518_01015 [Candidatus Aenigmarchaeota archaeon]|nr:hypothetical protein [Candidatus Aenigmarchaeota archaeon]
MASKKASTSAGSGKRQLSRQEEFEIMKLVLDKFLWLGFGVMTFGLYELYTRTGNSGFYVMFAGAAILVIFVLILVREYEISKPQL